MKRRVLSTIIALLLVAALLPMSVLAASYTDTDGHWAKSSIERWSDAGVVQGTGDAFAPDSDLTGHHSGKAAQTARRGRRGLQRQPRRRVVL